MSSWYFNRYPFLSNKKNTKAIERYAQFENNRQWQDIFNRFVSIVINTFEWVNMPETCDEYFFEKILLFDAKAAIIYDEDFNCFLSLPCVEAGGLNLYYENSYYRAVSTNYSKPFIALTKYNKDIIENITTGVMPSDNLFRGVVCSDNIVEYPMVEKIEIATTKIADTHRAIDVARKQLKIPSIIETDEDTKLSIQRAIELIDENGIAIYATKDLAKRLKETKPINTFTNPSNLIALWNNANNEYSEFLTAFGINNLNTADKAERLITDEVNSNNESIALNLAHRLDMRKHFCENFNAAFADIIGDKKLDVRIRHDFSEASYSSSKGVDNGNSADSTGDNLDS